MGSFVAHGALDGVYDETLYGWARYLGSEERVEVQIYHADRLLGSVVADQYRPDLEAANLGDGRCAFSWPIPEEYRDGSPHTLLIMTPDKDLIAQCSFTTPEPDPEMGRIPSKMPDSQNAIDLFAGGWLNRIPKPEGDFFASGEQSLFTTDFRPRWANEVFGDSLLGLKGKRILELGPMEGHHTWQLEQMGAEVTAIEGNPNCYLKCLVVKEVLGMKAKFFVGDFLQYLATPGTSFDLIMASGVLYHMVNPIELIYLLSTRTSNVYVWSHYWKEGIPSRRWFAERVAFGGFECTGYRRYYVRDEHSTRGYMGGLGGWSVWLPLESITAAFRHFGLSEITLHAHEEEHSEGPAISFSARVPRPASSREEG